MLWVWDPVSWGINVLNHLGFICAWWGICFGHLPAQAPSRVSQRQPGASQGGLIGVYGRGLTFCPYFCPHGSTDVFICTSPIKKYRYCPYEKVSRSESQLRPPGPRCPARSS